MMTADPSQAFQTAPEEPLQPLALGLDPFPFVSRQKGALSDLTFVLLSTSERDHFTLGRARPQT